MAKKLPVKALATYPNMTPRQFTQATMDDPNCKRFFRLGTWALAVAYDVNNHVYDIVAQQQYSTRIADEPHTLDGLGSSLMKSWVKENHQRTLDVEAMLHTLPAPHPAAADIIADCVAERETLAPYL